MNRSQLGCTVEEPLQAACAWTSQEAASMRYEYPRASAKISGCVKPKPPRRPVLACRKSQRAYLTKGGVWAPLPKPERWPQFSRNQCPDGSLSSKGCRGAWAQATCSTSCWDQSCAPWKTGRNSLEMEMLSPSSPAAGSLVIII